MDFTVVAENFCFDSPIFQKFNLPPLAGDGNFDHDGMVSVLAELVEDFPVSKPA